MGLHDLIPCVCGHPRYAHKGRWTMDVFGHETWHHGECSECDCKGYLDGLLDRPDDGPRTQRASRA